MLYKASATPRAAAPGAPQQGDGSSSLRASADDGLAGMRQRLQQLQGAAPAGARQEAQPQHGQPPQQAAAPAQQQQEQQQQQQAGTSSVAPSPARPAAAAAAKPAVSRLPAPPARASRLRPPTTSSGYFSNGATNSR